MKDTASGACPGCMRFFQLQPGATLVAPSVDNFMKRIVEFQHAVMVFFPIAPSLHFCIGAKVDKRRFGEKRARLAHDCFFQNPSNKMGFPGLIQIDKRDHGTSLGVDFHNPFFGQPDKGFPDGRSTHVQRCGESIFPIAGIVIRCQ